MKIINYLSEMLEIIEILSIQGDFKSTEDPKKPSFYLVLIV